MSVLWENDVCISRMKIVNLLLRMVHEIFIPLNLVILLEEKTI